MTEHSRWQLQSNSRITKPQHNYKGEFMKKSIVLLVGTCAAFLLAGCPKPGPTPDPQPSGACGSWHLPACPAEQYCKYETQANCGRADAPGVCTTKPEICLTIYKPVCGCDGKTYGNDCVAARNGVSVDHEGKCEQMCGGIANIQCPAGMNCVDDPNDGCDPATGADCSGICVHE